MTVKVENCKFSVKNEINLLKKVHFSETIRKLSIFLENFDTIEFDRYIFKIIVYTFSEIRIFFTKKQNLMQNFGKFNVFHQKFHQIDY